MKFCKNLYDEIILINEELDFTTTFDNSATCK